MQISIRPKSSLGRWSVGLAAAFILLYVLYLVQVASGGGLLPSPIASVAAVATSISCIAAFVTGLISIIKSKERSILVFLAVAVGLFVLIIPLGEILYPH